MARTIPASITSKLTDSSLSPFYAIDLEFPTAIYAWTGYGTLNVNGNAYLGIGDMYSINSVEESKNIGAKGISVGLTGIPSNLLSAALTANYQGRLCRLY